METQTPRTPRSIWLVALLVTLLAHALAGVGLLVLRPFAPAAVAAQDPEPIQLVFARDADPPRRFTELPEDRASEAPDQADLLSNVDSRARDQVPGGVEGAAPRTEGHSEFPQVAMQPGEAPSPPQEAQAEQPAPRTPESPKKSASRSMDMLQKRGSSGAASLLERPRGDLEIYQEEGNQDGNAPSGEISLNTYAWDFAPWLQRFRRDFVRNWFAPYAFYIGLVHGDNVVRVEIARDGRMLNLEVLAENGDASLTQSSVSAFNATAPFRPLPENFPEETLVLTVKLVYQQRERP